MNDAHNLDSLQVFNRARALERLGGDESLLAELIAIFMRTNVMQLTALRDALATGDLARGSREAHALKGAATNVGAERLVAALLQVEHSAAGGAPSGDLLTQVEIAERAMKLFIEALRSAGYGEPQENE